MKSSGEWCLCKIIDKNGNWFTKVKEKMNIHISTANVRNSFLKEYWIIISKEQLEIMQIQEEGISNSQINQTEINLKKSHISISDLHNSL